MVLLESNRITKTYTDMAEPVEVLKGIDFRLDEGQVAGIFGASGCGKSTLLHIIGGLDIPSTGSVSACGVALNTLKNDELSEFRNRKVGFVFQFYHLLPEFTAAENVMLPALIAGRTKREARHMAGEALDAMGLSERMEHRPAMLSGGEQQRVAIARAAVLRPPMILADEPTGNLDRETGGQVWNYLMELNRRDGIAIIVVTHNRELMTSLSTSHELRDGMLHAVSS